MLLSPLTMFDDKIRYKEEQTLAPGTLPVFVTTALKIVYADGLNKGLVGHKERGETVTCIAPSLLFL